VQKDVALQQNFLINAQPFWCPVIFIPICFSTNYSPNDSLITELLFTDSLSRRFFLNASSALFKAYRDFSKL